MASWIWLIAWTVLMYAAWLYLYRSWNARRRQRQESLWQQIGFHPDFNYQSGKTGIAIEQATHRIALREQNNLGVFAPDDIVSYCRSVMPAGGARRYYLKLRIRDPRKPDWRVAFGSDEQEWDVFYAQLCRILPGKEMPAGE